MITTQLLPNTLLPHAAIRQLTGKVCDMTYLLNMSRGNKMIIQNILAVFFKETAKELGRLRKAIKNNDYTTISNISHKLKSAFSILGIVILEPVFKEMEYLSNIIPAEKIEQLSQQVTHVFNQARVEMKYMC